MRRATWQAALVQSLRQHRTRERAPRVALVGIGNELCADDAAGVLLVRELKNRYTSALHTSTLLLDAGCAPENVTGTLRRFAPDLVVLADAAQLGEAPGTVRWLDAREAVGVSASTHTLPLHMLAHYLEAELGCAVALLAIQPARCEMGAPLSAPVERALVSICDILSDL